VIWQRFGPMWGGSIAWFAVLAAAHVLANAHVTRQSHTAPTLDDNSDSQNGPEDPIVDASTRFAPITRLGNHHGPANSALLGIVSVGAVLGAIAGVVGLVMLKTATFSGILLGVFSAAALGGFLGFVSGSFCLVLSRAFQEAAGNAKLSPAAISGEVA